MSGSNLNIVGRLILAMSITTASVALATLSVGWAAEHFAPSYPYNTMSPVVTGSILPVTFGAMCAFVLRADKTVGAIALFFSALFSFAIGVGIITEDSHAAIPDSGTCSLIVGGAFALLTAVNVITGYAIASAVRLKDSNQK